VQPLHPDMVVLAFYAGNDVANNARLLSAAGQTEKPYFHEQPDGTLNLDTSFRTTAPFQKSVAQDWRKRAINSSYLLQAVKQAALGKPIVPDPKPLDAVHIGDLHEQAMLAPEYAELFSAPPDATWAGAWSVTEKLLVSMRDWTQAQHMHFGLIIIPPPVAVLPTQELRQKASAKFGLKDLQYPVERIARFAAEAGISFLDLRQALRNAGDSERIYLYGFAPRYGDGHLNATGNAVSSNVIARWLCERPPLQQ
jgi:hypothetical protein